MSLKAEKDARTRVANRGANALNVWHEELLDWLPEPLDQNRDNINGWLDDFERVFTATAIAGIMTGGRGGYVRVNGKTSMQTFRELYQTRIRQLTAQDLTRATMLRNNLASRVGSGWEIMSEAYDSLLNRLGYSPRQVTGQIRTSIYNIFREVPLVKDKIGLLDGAGRVWQPDAYARMYTQTRSAEIADVVFRDEMLATGQDIVRVTDVNTDTPICLEYEGKYYSLNGKTPGLPVLDIATPFHPNCRHDIIMAESQEVTEGMVRQNASRDTKFDKARGGFSQGQNRSVERQREWNKSHRMGEPSEKQNARDSERLQTYVG